MTTEQLRTALRSTPFRPFTIRMADGRTLAIAHPDFLSMSPAGRTVVVFHPDDSASIVDLLLMTEIELSPPTGTHAYKALQLTRQIGGLGSDFRYGFGGGPIDQRLIARLWKLRLVYPGYAEDGEAQITVMKHRWGFGSRSWTLRGAMRGHSAQLNPPASAGG